MKTNTKPIKLILVLVLTFSLISGCAKPEPTVQEPIDIDPVKQELLNDINSLAEIKDFESISVSAYWVSIHARFRAPLNINDLIRLEEGVFHLEGNELDGKLDLFSQIQADDIQIAQGERFENARYYLVIESNVDGKLFELLLFKGWSNMSVNGIEIRPSKKILDAIYPLLTPGARYELRRYSKWF